MTESVHCSATSVLSGGPVKSWHQYPCSNTRTSSKNRKTQITDYTSYCLKEALTLSICTGKKLLNNPNARTVLSLGMSESQMSSGAIAIGRHPCLVIFIQILYCHFESKLTYFSLTYEYRYFMSKDHFENLTFKSILSAKGHSRFILQLIIIFLYYIYISLN